jgi:hypothetical protein
MLKKVLIIAVLLSLVGILGCSTTSGTGTTALPASVTTVREAKIASVWSMKQMEINLESETEIDIKLAAGDKVDGYFYIVNGDNITFSISGNSLIYESKAPGASGKSVASDRFSFTASQAQGIAYTLKFNVIEGSSKDKNSATVFLEFIYPATGTVLVPIGTK